jgi:hypothetical protein
MMYAVEMGSGVTIYTPSIIKIGFYQSKVDGVIYQLKVNLSLYMPWRPLGLREVEALTFSHIRLIDGGKVASPISRPHFIPRKIPGTHFC